MLQDRLMELAGKRDKWVIENDGEHVKLTERTEYRYGEYGIGSIFLELNVAENGDKVTVCSLRSTAKFGNTKQNKAKLSKAWEAKDTTENTFESIEEMYTCMERLKRTMSHIMEVNENKTWAQTNKVALNVNGKQVVFKIRPCTPREV